MKLKGTEGMEVLPFADDKGEEKLKSKKKIPYITTCAQCSAYKPSIFVNSKARCLHELRDLTKEEEIYIPDWCPFHDWKGYI